MKLPGRLSEALLLRAELMRKIEEERMRAEADRVLALEQERLAHLDSMRRDFLVNVLGSHVGWEVQKYEEKTDELWYRQDGITLKVAHNGRITFGATTITSFDDLARAYASTHPAPSVATMVNPVSPLPSIYAGHQRPADYYPEGSVE